jgi:hypothetical protein
MTLQRYNQIAIAILSTLAFAGIAAIAVIAADNTFGKRDTQGISIGHSDRPKQKENLVLCLPEHVAGSDYEYFPVAAVVAADEHETPILASARVFKYEYDAAFAGYCGRSGYGRIFNVAVKNIRTQEERLLLAKPAQVVSLIVPDEKCKEGAGQLPCGTLLWTLRPTDTNKDGTIDYKDAAVAYLSGESAVELTQLTPLDTTFLSARWIAEQRTLLLQIRRDTNKDGQFTEEDGSEVTAVSLDHPAMGTPALKGEILKTLSAVLQ